MKFRLLILIVLMLTSACHMPGFPGRRGPRVPGPSLPTPGRFVPGPSLGAPPVGVPSPADRYNPSWTINGPQPLFQCLQFCIGSRW